MEAEWRGSAADRKLRVTCSCPPQLLVCLTNLPLKPNLRFPVLSSPKCQTVRSHCPHVPSARSSAFMYLRFCGGFEGCFPHAGGCDFDHLLDSCGKTLTVTAAALQEWAQKADPGVFTTQPQSKHSHTLGRYLPHRAQNQGMLALCSGES